MFHFAFAGGATLLVVAVVAFFVLRKYNRLQKELAGARNSVAAHCALVQQLVELLKNQQRQIVPILASPQGKGQASESKGSEYYPHCSPAAGSGGDEVGFTACDDSDVRTTKASCCGEEDHLAAKTQPAATSSTSPNITFASEPDDAASHMSISSSAKQLQPQLPAAAATMFSSQNCSEVDALTALLMESDEAEDAFDLIHQSPMHPIE